MSTETKIRTWIAVYTAPNVELAVRDALTSLSEDRPWTYPVLVPTGMVQVTHARRTMLVERPVFPRYVFVGVPEGVSWYPVKNAKGVTGVLCAAGKPRPIPDKLVQLLKAAVDADAFTRSNEQAFKVGDAVNVRVGQTTLKAFVERVNAELPAKRIDILFEAWGKLHKSTVPVDQIQAA